MTEDMRGLGYSRPLHLRMRVSDVCRYHVSVLNDLK